VTTGKPPSSPSMMTTRILLSALALTLATEAATAQTAAAPDRRARSVASPSTQAIRGTVTGDDIIRAARRHLGVPYRLGGTTPRAFDCSGFVRHVFAEYGLGLPRTAKEQAGVGDAPPAGELQPGDLLFFYGGRGAQHIAIYVGGDTIIHASSAGRRVKLDVLTGPRTKQTWFRKRLIAVRRVLPAEGVFYLPSSGPAVAASSALSPAEVVKAGAGRESGSVRLSDARASARTVGAQ
jgi:cell wall-associated NlpC family hydrolase